MNQISILLQEIEALKLKVIGLEEVNVALRKEIKVLNEVTEQLDITIAEYVVLDAASMEEITALKEEKKKLKVELEDLFEKQVTWVTEHPTYQLSKKLEQENIIIKDTITEYVRNFECQLDCDCCNNNAGNLTELKLIIEP